MNPLFQLPALAGRTLTRMVKALAGCCRTAAHIPFGAQRDLGMSAFRPRPQAHACCACDCGA